jgi:hypothetical protein
MFGGMATVVILNIVVGVVVGVFSAAVDGTPTAGAAVAATYTGGLVGDELSPGRVSTKVPELLSIVHDLKRDRKLRPNKGEAASDGIILASTLVTV